MTILDSGISPFIIAGLTNGSMFAAAIFLAKSRRTSMVVAGACMVLLVGPAILLLLRLPFTASIYGLLTIAISLIFGRRKRRAGGMDEPSRL